MTICAHRGFEFDGKRCPYHGLTVDGCQNFFDKQPDKLNTKRPSFFKNLLGRKWGIKFLEIRQDVKAPHYLWAENTCDVLHLATTHPKFSKNLWCNPFDKGISEDGKDSYHYLRVREEVCNGYRRILNLPVGYGNNFFLHYFVFPHFSITSFMDIFFSAEWIGEVGDKNCSVHTKFFVAEGLKVPKLLLKAASEANSQILKEDKELVEKWAKTYRETGNWCSGEERVVALHEAFRKEGYL